MEETEQRDGKNSTNKCITRKKKKKNGSSGKTNSPSFDYKQQYHHYQIPLYHYTSQLGFFNQNDLYRTYYPALLPSPPLLPLRFAFNSPIQDHSFRPKFRLQKFSSTHSTDSPVSNNINACSVELNKQRQRREVRPKVNGSTKPPLVAARRPDEGGKGGTVIPLLANHFLVRFDSSAKIFHYNIDISPHPSKEVARMIKQKLVEDNPKALSKCGLAFDGRKNLYSPVEFLNEGVEFYVTLPTGPAISSGSFDDGDDQSMNSTRHCKPFRISIKLVSKLDGEALGEYLKKEADDGMALPQDFLQALDVILREGPQEKSIAVGRSLYSNSMDVGKEIGGGLVGWRGFFQSLRPTQQGLVLNMDLSVAAFHESIGVIPFILKRFESLQDLSHNKFRSLTGEERKEVEKALKNLRIFVRHRETVERYRVYGLTEEATEDLWFTDRDGRRIHLLSYYKQQYNYDIQHRKLPCLQISRSKPCHLPMELCMICEGQKFLGKLSDDQTARLLKMSCQKPRERRALIEGVMRGPLTSRNEGKAYKLDVSKEMTRLNGRILQPPKLRLGDGGNVRDLIPFRYDRQWNLLNSHVVEGKRIEKWAIISFGGTQEQKSNIPKFINQLSQRCQQLGIFLNKSTATGPVYETNQVLNNVTLLESTLKAIQKAAAGSLQLLICIMEKKHKGYADLKRISETNIGVVSQCCLYPNLSKLNSQFLANLALKINAKVGGCTVALYTSLPCQIPRLFSLEEPTIFMGADVTHPHPLDDVSPSVAAVVGSMNWPAANKYVSRMRSQTHRQEIIQDLAAMVKELLDEFLLEVNKLPSRIIFFRDGVSETQFYKVLQEELEAIKQACSMFESYNPTITFSVVQKRHHTRLFPDEKHLSSVLNQLSDENIPPGTVVDTVITHPREFDFYLCSHLGIKGTSRPTHYHVLWDENEFTSDELQNLVYNLCFTFVRCTKPVSLVPPVYYAHLAAYRGRLYLERPELSSFSGRNTSFSRPGPPVATPLPKLNDKLKKLMFYC